MQNDAFKITGFTAVISALGFLSRWLQNMQLYDEAGLPVAGKAISVWIVVLIVLTAATLAVFVRRLRACAVPETPEAMLTHKTFLFPAIGVIAAALLLCGGVSMLLKAGEFPFPVLRRIQGLLALAAALCAGELTLHADKPEHARARVASAAVVVLYVSFWLIVVYKESSSDPATWRFAAEILAGCAAVTACYYMTGLELRQTKPLSSIFFCFLAMFLCVMCIIDDHHVCDILSYVAFTLLFALWGFTLTENLKKPESDFKFKL